MTRIFVVTSGEYSDYRLDAMFSTKEKAEQYIARRDEISKRAGWGHYDSNGIDEWQLDGVNDDWLNGSLELWVVWFEHDSAQIRSVEFHSDGDSVEGVTFFKPHGKYQGGCRVYVLAETKERAIKVAMERRAMAIARGDAP